MLPGVPDPCHLGPELHLDATFPQRLLDDLDEVTVDPWQQLRGQFDEMHLTSEAGIHGAELQPDVAPADDQQALGDVAQLQGFTRGHDALAIEVNAWEVNRARAGRDDRLLEGQGAGASLADAEPARSHECGMTMDDLDAAPRRQLLQALGQLRQNAVFPLPHAGRLDRNP